MRCKISICLLLFAFLSGIGIVSSTSGGDSLRHRIIEEDSARLPVGKGIFSREKVAQWVDNAPGEPWAKDLFPNLKLIWEKEFDGKIRDIKVGGENVVVFWEKDRLDIISFLDSCGNPMWEKSFKFEQHKSGYGSGTVRNISISRNGESVIINFVSTHWDDVGDRAHVNSCDRDENLKWETTVYNPGLTLSPKGDYAITTCQSGEEMKGFFRLFDNKTGEELWSDVEKGINWSAAWLNDSEIAYVKGKGGGSLCKLLLFDAENLQAKWMVDIGEELGDKKHYGIVWETPKVKSSRDGELIAVVADYFGPEGKRRRTSLMLNNQGKILWHNGGLATPSGVFSPDSNGLFIGCSGRAVVLIDALTGKEKWCSRRFDRHLGSIEYGFTSEKYLIASFNLWEGKRRRIAIFDLETGELQRKPEIYDEIASIIPIVDSQNKLYALILLSQDKKRIQKLVVGQ